MRESLAARTWPSLNWAQQTRRGARLTTSGWGGNDGFTSEERWANIVMRRGQPVFCSQHDVWELYGWPYLLPNETDKWRGGELSRRKNSALACKLRTATHYTALREPGGVQRGWMWVCSCGDGDLSHANCSRQIYNGVFMKSHANAINHFLRNYLLSLWVINGGRWWVARWDNLVTGLVPQVMASAAIFPGPEVLHVESINDQQGDNITQRVANDIILARKSDLIWIMMRVMKAS